MLLKNVPQSLNRNNNNKNSNREKKKRKGKKARINHRANQNMRIILNVFFLSQLSAYFPPARRHSPPLPPKEALQCWGGLISGPVVGISQTLIWSYSCVCVPPVSTACRALECFLFWEHSLSFHRSQRHRVFPVDLVNLICSLFS